MTEKKPLKIDIQSEIGELEAVLLHTPGAEVENMTPKMAQRALYSDILNLSIAQEEYEQLSGVLKKLAKVYTVSDMLVKVLDNESERQALIGKICVMEQVTEYFDMLMEMSSAKLAKVLIEGLPAKINTLTSFLNEDYYALFPLYNFYFTRDASVTIGNNALICKMANRVRTRESLIMEAIYKGSGEFSCGIINAYDYQPGNSNIYMEGGDILIARDDILLLGNGARTSTQGIDLLAARLGALAPEGRRHIIVQQLPRTPESFIHLDMVFTLLDRDKCMVFEPLILGDNQYQTVHITMENGKRPHHHGERQGGQDQQCLQHPVSPAPPGHGPRADSMRRRVRRMGPGEGAVAQRSQLLRICPRQGHLLCPQHPYPQRARQARLRDHPRMGRNRRQGVSGREQALRCHH